MSWFAPEAPRTIPVGRIEGKFSLRETPVIKMPQGTASHSYRGATVTTLCTECGKAVTDKKSANRITCSYACARIRKNRVTREMREVNGSINNVLRVGVRGGEFVPVASDEPKRSERRIKDSVLKIRKVIRAELLNKSMQKFDNCGSGG